MANRVLINSSQGVRVSKSGKNAETGPDADMLLSGSTSPYRPSFSGSAVVGHGGNVRLNFAISYTEGAFVMFKGLDTTANPPRAHLPSDELYSRHFRGDTFVRIYNRTGKTLTIDYQVYLEDF